MKRVLHLVAASALFGCAAVPSAVDARGRAGQPELAAVADDAAPRFVTDDNARRIFCGAAPGCAAATADAAVVADEVTLFRLDHTATVRSDGRVLFSDAGGARRAELPERDARELIRRVASAGAGFGLAAPRTCEHFMTDVPFESVVLSRVGRPPVRFEVCDGATFVTLARLTDEAVGAALAARFDEPVLASKEPVGRP